MKPVLFHLQHLFGSGHIQRIRGLAETLAKSGYPVALMSGGREHPALSDPSIRLFKLPGITAGAGLGEIVDLDGNPVSDSLWEQRSSLVRKILLELEPAVIITEGFPFARRRFSGEMLEMLDAARTTLLEPPIVLCSVRDIIQPIERTDRQTQVIRMLNKYYDEVVVHGERSFVSLETSFGRLSEIEIPISHTGYLDAGSMDFQTTVKNPQLVVVSAGGGIAGQAIYEAAIEAASTTRGTVWKWHILIGGAVDEDALLRWQKNSPDHVTVERNRDDFRQLLASCAVSVSQIGYNTMIDLVQTGTRGVVIPYEADEEKEQTMRANALMQFDHVKVLRESDLSAETLMNAITQGISENKAPVSPFRADGAERFLSKIDSIYPMSA
ncbi:MAG: glycosyltransferase [Gammaproteobacteria bacterium]|nr:glycosyltransferase [Gammaproteobacteria bacterium]MCY4227178.1 glycosyltransferase [Gammaproteobacteria bacterium]